MKIRLILSCFVLGTMLLPAGGFQLNEHGTRAMAMGGAYTARAFDASAVYFNPAGLGFQHSNSIYLGATIIKPKIKFYGPYNYSLNSVNEMKDQTFTPINFYVKYGIDENFHVGIGMYNPYGLGTEWDKSWVGRDKNIKADLQTYAFTPTLAYKFSDELSLGIGLNYIYGTALFRQEVSPFPFSPSPVATLELTGKTFGFNVGALYKISSDLSVGISYRSESTIEGKGTATFDPKFPSTTPAQNLTEDNVTGKIALPSTMFVGIAYTVMEHLDIEADYQYVGWAAYKELKIDFTKDPSKNTVYPKNYTNTFIMRTGAEYSMDDLQLRIGYFYDRSPVSEQYVDPVLPDANRSGLNFGFGYKLSSDLSFDAAYMMLIVDQRKVENTISAFDGTYQTKANLFAFDIGYTF